MAFKIYFVSAMSTSPGVPIVADSAGAERTAAGERRAKRTLREMYSIVIIVGRGRGNG